MELTKDKVQEDFEIIKNTIEQADKKQKDISGLLLRYGLVQLALFIIVTTNFVLRWQMNGFWPQVIIVALQLLLYIYITIFYFKVYRNVRMSSNKYFLGFLVIFGVIAVIYPYIEILFRFAGFWADFSSMESMIRLANYHSLLNIILFCVCLIVCGFITNKKIFVIISVLILTLFLTMDLFDVYIYFTEMGIGVPGIIRAVCTTFGYIALSFVIKWRKSNGD